MQRVPSTQLMPPPSAVAPSTAIALTPPSLGRNVRPCFFKHCFPLTPPLCLIVVCQCTHHLLCGNTCNVPETCAGAIPQELSDPAASHPRGSHRSLNVSCPRLYTLSVAFQSAHRAVKPQVLGYP